MQLLSQIAVANLGTNLTAGVPGIVYATAKWRNLIFLGGSFTSIDPLPGSTAGGGSRTGFAIIDSSDGYLLTAWAPVFENSQTLLIVYDFAIYGSTLYVVGQFTAVDGQPRNGACAFDIPTQTLLAWDAGVSESSGIGFVRAVTTNSDGSAIYLSGRFDTVQGQPQLESAAFDQNGNVLPWLLTPTPLASAEQIAALAWNSLDGQVYLGGGQSYPTGPSGGDETYARRQDPLTGAADLSWVVTDNTAVGPDYGAWDFLFTPQAIYVSGSFVDPQQVQDAGKRNFLRALDPVTGAVLPFAAQILPQFEDNAGTSVDLSPDGQTIFLAGRVLGGSGNVVDGGLQIAAGYDLLTGRVVWNPLIGAIFQGAYVIRAFDTELVVGGEILDSPHNPGSGFMIFPYLPVVVPLPGEEEGLERQEVSDEPERYGDDFPSGYPQVQVEPPEFRYLAGVPSWTGLSVSGVGELREPAPPPVVRHIVTGFRTAGPLPLIFYCTGLAQRLCFARGSMDVEMRVVAEACTLLEAQGKCEVGVYCRQYGGFIRRAKASLAGKRRRPNVFRS